MTIYSTESFIVHFDRNKTKPDQIKLLVGALQEKLGKLLLFFELDKLKEPIDIYIYADKDEYKKHILKYTVTYQDWMIGDTNDGNINMLSFENCGATQSHKGMTMPEYVRVFTHELTHICQQQVNPNAYGCEWFWEALALNLSEQIIPETTIDCTREQLMFHYTSLPNGYSISYTIGKYMLENYAHKRLLNYITNPQQLWDDTKIILSNVKSKSPI